MSMPAEIGWTMSQAEEWDWPPPREMRSERFARAHPVPTNRTSRRGADLFLATIIGLYRAALAAALGGLVVGCLFLLVAILRA
jgi:hypothetical protein